VEIQLAVPETHVSADVLDAALEAVTRLDEDMIVKGKAPPLDRVLAAGRVRWQPEPPGAERFDNAAVVFGRGWGDCDDLAPWHAATLRANGIDPEATAFARQSGPGRWHAVVRRSDGSVDDPSIAAGMGQSNGFAPAVTSPMYRPAPGIHGEWVMKPSLAVRRIVGGWEGRADLPWSQSDYAMASLARMPTAATALTGAIVGVRELHAASGFADEEDADALLAVGAFLDGHNAYEIAAVVGDDVMRRAHAIARSVMGAARKIKPLRVPHLAAVSY
jgi:hypothetical protein